MEVETGVVLSRIEALLEDREGEATLMEVEVLVASEEVEEEELPIKTS